LRAEKILQDRVFKSRNINIVWDSEVIEICGDSKPGLGVESVKVINLITKTSSDISAQGCFVAIGHTPATEPFRNKIDMDKDGYIIVSQGTTKTNVAGIFAAGDCVDKVYRQAVTAAGLGCMSALESEKYMASLED
jgi:thioredoxin reductase (NADPH)